MKRQYVEHRRKPGWTGYIHEFPMWGTNRQLAAVYWTEAIGDNGEAIALTSPLRTYAIADLINVERKK